MLINERLSLIGKDEFDFLVKNGKRSSILANFEFESLIFSGWGLIKEQLPDLFAKGEFDKLFYELLKDRGVNVFWVTVQNIGTNEAIKFILWIRDELEDLSNLEKTYLVSSPSAKMFQAGINRLDQFGSLNTIDNLANGDILKYDEVRKLRYNVVFDKQYRDIIVSQVQEKLSKIK
jgi:hypothetical protein